MQKRTRTKISIRMSQMEKDNDKRGVGVPVMPHLGSEERSSTFVADQGQQAGPITSVLQSKIPNSGAIVSKILLSAAAWSALASIAVAITTIFYTIYAHRQWIAMSGQIQVMRDANGLTYEALKGSDQALRQTLDKMEQQIGQSRILATNAGTQATQTTQLSTDTHDLALEARLQAKAANELATVSAGQLATMRSELELRDRPWIKVVGFKLRGDSDEIGALSFRSMRQYQKETGILYTISMNYQLTTKNVGGSAALNVNTIPELYLPRWGKYDIEAEEKRFCDQMQKNFASKGEGGRTLFPNENREEFQAAFGNVKEENITRLSGDGTNYVLPVLIGCVDYQFQSSPVHHQTRFVYELFHVDRTRFFELGRDVKAKDISAIQNEGSDFAY